jgi:NADH:ubiquinone oxidoreductase subunit 3 (subunit A)
MLARPSRVRALAIVLVLYACAQLLSFSFLISAKPYSAGKMWTFGALGPLAAVTAVPRFQYHSLVGNALFVAFCVLVLAAPLAYAMRPRRWTLAVTVIGLLVWCVFGIGFTIDHL